MEIRSKLTALRDAFPYKGALTGSRNCAFGLARRRPQGVRLPDS